MKKELKITEEQLRTLKSKLDSYMRLRIEIGDLDIRKHQLLHDAVSAKERLQDYQSELNSLYGDISINIEDGSYTKNED